MAAGSRAVLLYLTCVLCGAGAEVPRKKTQALPFAVRGIEHWQKLTSQRGSMNLRFLLLTTTLGLVNMSCGAKSDDSTPCGAQGQACCASSQMRVFPAMRAAFARSKRRQLRARVA